MTDIETTGDLIRVQAAGRGSHPALTFARRSMSYAELDNRSNHVAQALLAAGVETQDRVAFLDKNTPEHFEVLFGCAKTSSVLVPVNWRLAPQEIAYIVNDAAAKVLIVGEELAAILDKIEADLHTVMKVVVIGGHPRHEAYESWVTRHDAVDPLLAATGSDVALQMYTSGTTGLPKGVMLTNDNLWSIVPITQAWGISSMSVSLVCMPLFHMAGTGWSLPAMYQGCHIVLLREPDPAAILAAIPAHGVTDALFVPALLQLLLASPDCVETDFSSLRTIFYGASPIADDVLVRSIATFQCRFMQLYGLTEATGFATALPPEDHLPDAPHPERRRSVGVTPDGIEVRIADPKSGDEQPIDAVGEIWIRSRGVMKGYWNQPDETAASITPDGWLRSGDAAYRDADGYVYMYDRVKDMIVSGGENVYPAEVENALHDHPAVADVAVIGVPHERWGETVKAIVVLAAGAPVTEGELIVFARERLAHYKCPTSVDFTSELPRNASGKVLKRDLREPYWAGHDRRVH